TDGTSELIDVLLLHRSLPAAAVIAGIDAALRVGAVSAEVVAVEARRAEARLLAHASVAADQTGGANAGRHLDRHAERREQRVVS
ncbi:IS21 family transposase, partial [Mycobacterium kansasii]